RRCEINPLVAKPLDQLPVPRLAIPLHDTRGDDFTDVLGCGELIDTRGEDAVEIREAASDRLGDSSADVQDAKPVEDAPHVAGFAGCHAIEEIARGLLAHALEVRDLIQFEPVKISDVASQSVLD